MSGIGEFIGPAARIAKGRHGPFSGIGARSTDILGRFPIMCGGG
jgi:hypothetical protein